jgi:hypothetical protein
MFKPIFFILLLVLSAPTMADCSYNGGVYPEGTVMGPYVCAGNQWVGR